jgi:hypothetical protein
LVDPFAPTVVPREQSFLNRYGLLPSYGYDDRGVAALAQLDYNKAIRGGNLIPKTQLPAVLAAARTGQAQAAPQGHSSNGPIGWVERFGRDAAMFARSLPQIPGELVKQAKELPQAPEEIAQAIQEGKPLHAFNAPGLNLIPGSYVLSHGVHTFNEHPLFALMDVAPYAKLVAPGLSNLALKAGESVAPELTQAAKEQVNLMRDTSSFGRVARGTARTLAQQRRIGATEAQELVAATKSGMQSIAVQKAVKTTAKNARKVGRSLLERDYGATADQIASQYSTLIDRYARRNGGNTDLALQQFIDDNFQKLSNKSEVYVPHQVKSIMDATTKALDQSNPFRGPLGKVMGVYRTAILPLSPRWHAYNLVGGAILTAGQTGLTGFLRQIPEAWRMARDGSLPVEISHGWVSLPAEERAALQAEFSGRGGILARTINKGLQGTGKSALRWLWDANEKVDNFYRSISYLEGTRKGLAHNLETDAAKAEGVKLANKTLQDWDAQLPWERTVMKQIFPFYGWMHHILKYVSSYPIDHPIRTSITANIARAEINDWKTGLPQDFQNYFYWGGDKQGNEKGFNLRGANPFSDTSSIFNLGGLISQLNPIAGGLLEAAGLNPTSGRASLYANVDYDPNTGRLVAQQPSTPSAALSTAEGFVPQLQFLRYITGFKSKSDKEMALANPDAYRQMAFSSFGIPIPRTINKTYETAKAELNRQATMQQAMSDAVRSGDYSQVKKYPQLKEWVKLIQELDKSGALDQYRIQSPTGGVTDPQVLLQRLRSARG